MNKRKLGRTNLYVSELCLSTEGFGSITNEATSFAMLDTYYSTDGSFIQSLGCASHTAAAPVVENASQDFVGRWLESRGIVRDSLVLASRINFRRPAHGGSIAFANLIRESCERSLRRLRTRHLDLLICNWDERLLPVEDVLESVDMLIRAGLVRYVVAGDFPSWRVVDSLHRSGARNHARFEALQTEYSLMTRARFEPDALAMCRENRLGFLARSPLADAVFTQRPLSLRDPIYANRTWQGASLGVYAGDAVLKVLSEIADRHLATPASLALAWVLHNSQVTAAVVSASDPDQVRELISAADVVLTAEETGALAQVTNVPAPGLELRHV